LSGVSSSHLRRIERGERFPSAAILRKIAKPLGFSESELLSLADYLPPESSEAQRLPEFRDYARSKYPELDEDMITMIEDILEHPKRQS